MNHYQETTTFMLHSLETSGMVYAIRNKQITVAAAARIVWHYFNIGSELNQPADNKKWSVDDDNLVSNEFSKDLMDEKTNLQKVKGKKVTSPLEDRASLKQVYNMLRKVSELLFKAIVGGYI